MRLLLSLFLLTHPVLQADVLIDRIAIVVGKSIIKDSDIDRDVRITEFLNREPLHVDQVERQKAAKRLIDQVLLRSEIRQGGYPGPTGQEVDSQMNGLVRNRFASEEALESSLKTYGIDKTKVRDQLRWQLTILQFVDLRFKPAAIVPDSSVDAYYREHKTALRRNFPQASEKELLAQAKDVLVGEQENQLLYSWLDERRKDTQIKYLEDRLA